MDLSLFELLLSLLATVSAIVTSFYVIWQFRRAQSTITDLIPNLDDYIFQEDGTWQMDERLVKVFEVIGSRMALSMRQSFFQAQGVDAKLKKGLEKKVVGAFVDSKFGGLKAIAHFLGIDTSEIEEYLIENPSALKSLGPMVSQFMPRGANSPGHSDESVGYG